MRCCRRRLSSRRRREDRRHTFHTCAEAKERAARFESALMPVRCRAGVLVTRSRSVGTKWWAEEEEEEVVFHDTEE